MTTHTPEQFKQWSIAHKPLAKAVCMAMAFAQIERERVDAYVLPIFQSFKFVDENGEKITSPKYLFLSQDEAMCKAFYARCDAAHRQNGFTGPDGHNPALIAESLLIDAENLLLQAGCKFFDLDVSLVFGDNRKKMLDLLLGACMTGAVSGGTSR